MEKEKTSRTEKVFALHYHNVLLLITSQLLTIAILIVLGYLLIETRVELKNTSTRLTQVQSTMNNMIEESINTPVSY